MDASALAAAHLTYSLLSLQCLTSKGWECGVCATESSPEVQVGELRIVRHAGRQKLAALLVELASAAK